MNWLIPAIVSTLLGTVVLVLVYAYLSVQFRHRYLTIWTAGWSIYAVRYIFELVFEWSGKQPIFTLFSQVAALVSGLLLLWGTYSFLGRKLPRGWVIATLLGVLWTFGAGLGQAGFLILTAPTYTLLALVFIWTGWVFLRSPELDANGRRVIGWAFILWGLHKVDFPFLRQIVWFAAPGFMFSAVLEILVAAVFLLIYFQRVLQERRQAEEQYSTILRTTMDGYWLSDLEGWILDVNDAICQMLGYPREEMLSLNVMDIGLHHSQSEAQEHRSQVWQDKGDRFESQLRRKDGALVDVEISVNLQTFGKGGMVALVRDITARKLYEKALKDSEARFRLLVENVPTAIVISHRGIIDFVNPAYSKIFGFEPQEVIGQEISIHLAPAAQAQVQQRNLRREDGEAVPAVYEALGQTKNGKTVPLLINASAILMGETRSTLATISDLTLIRQAEAAARLSEARFRGFFEYSQAGMVILDREFRFIVVNEATASLVGLPIDAILGRTIYEILPEFDGQDERIITNIFSGGPPVANFESGGRSPHRGNQKIYYQASFFPLFGEEDEITSVGVVIVDRTARHQVEMMLHERVAELEVVSRVSTILRANRELSDLLPETLKDILASLNAQAGAILLYDGQTSRVERGAAQGWVTDIPLSLLASQKPTLENVLKVRQPFVVEDLTKLPQLTEQVRGYVPENWAGVILPLIAQDEPLGVMAVLAPRPFKSDDAQLRLLRTLAEMIGAALHRSRLAEHTNRNLHRLAALHEIDTIITSSLDLRLTLEVLLGHALNHLEVNAVEILKYNQFTQQLEPLVSRGFRVQRSDARALRPGQGPAGRALVERRLVELYLDEARQEAPELDPVYRAEGARTILAMPLMSKGQVVGVIVAISRDANRVDREALEFFATLASQAALAIDDIGMLEKLRRSNLEMGQSVMATLQGLAKIVELRKQEPDGHTEQLVELTLRLAAAMQVPQSEWLAIHHGVLLHDVGLMWIPDRILLKEGPLNAEEWEVVQRHSQFVYELFSPIAYLRPALDIPYCHHEKWDGSGYPRGLKGSQIPLSARIFAVAEAWDSMQVSRPFRDALPVRDAMQQIAALSGSVYDPAVVEKFLAMLAE